MASAVADEGSGGLGVFNYCVSFIDLLGQRNAVQNQSILPAFQSEDERQAFHSVLKESVGSILELQIEAATMVAHISSPRSDSPLRARLPPEDQATWDQMKLTRITTQRWSDGIVSFISLGDTEIKCPVNGIFGLIGLAGSLALLGLARKRPVRGGIEIAWGAELHPGELYGPAVARAYELESEVADYPRVVVGPQVYRYLRSHLDNRDPDKFSRYNRLLAGSCLQLLMQDADGRLILHYLGTEFQNTISQQNHRELYEMADRYVLEQLQDHRKRGNTKLAFRYDHLARYFRDHQPGQPAST